MGRISGKESRSLLVLGAATSPHVLARARIFTTLGWQVTMLSPVEAKAVPNDIKIISTARGAGAIGKLRSLLACARLLLVLPFDLVHAHYAAEYGTWLAAILKKRKPLVVTVMGGDILFAEQGSLGALGRFLTRLSLRRADYITAKSQRLADTLETFDIRPNCVDVIYWGVEPDLFQPSHQAGEQYRVELAIPEKRRVIYCPRMLNRLYNQNLIIDAMPSVLASHPDVHLILSGFGREEAFGTEIEDQIDRMDLRDHVTISGPLQRHEMAAAYNSADVVISIPSSDGMPQSVLEAMACEKPVIVSDLDHYRELFSDGETAAFTELDALKIADSINDLLSDLVKAKRIAQASATLVKNTAHFPTQAKHVADKFELLIAGKKG